MEEELIRDASKEASREFKTLINSDDLDSLKQLQYLILGRLQDSNAVLSHFNEYSENCFAEVSGDFSRNTRLLRSMKSDLDYIFQKLSITLLRMQHLITFGGSNTSILDVRCSYTLVFCNEQFRSMKAKITATYPDAFPDESAREALDQRPDLEMP
ncbi:hypothetical protein EZV62_027400 [Acer yangbiense]|uniref:KxDL domain-containing protein n=1 Tax=Acer yangbiense TaxID=1000413 RepID=A0A5C7GVG1_9ROSI|nr:hypothetical protein EZV62_027400 [Acer yangbiense]